MASESQAEPIIKTQRLLLRPVEQSDAAQVHVMRSSPEAMLFTTSLPATDISQTEEWLAGNLSRPNYYSFIVSELSNPSKVIGILGAVRTPEVGYKFHPDYWGKGYATEALTAFLPFLWEHVDPVTAPEGRRYDYSFAITDAENVASRKTLEKCGYVLEKVTHKDFESPTLGWRDRAFYRLERPGNGQRAMEAADVSSV